MTTPPHRPQPSGQLLAIGIIGLLLGALGGCVGLSTIATSAAPGTMQQVQRTQLETQYRDRPDLLQRQLELQEDLQAATDRWVPLSVAHQSLNAVASIALMIACILLFLWHRRAPGLFLAAASASLVIDLLGVGATIVMQLALRDAMRTYLTATATADPNMPPGMGDLMGSFAQASVGASLCLGIGFFGIKSAYYIWGILYVRKESTRALFVPQPPPSASSGAPQDPSSQLPR